MRCVALILRSISQIMVEENFWTLQHHGTNLLLQCRPIYLYSIYIYIHMYLLRSVAPCAGRDPNEPICMTKVPHGALSPFEADLEVWKGRAEQSISYIWPIYMPGRGVESVDLASF